MLAITVLSVPGVAPGRRRYQRPNIRLTRTRNVDGMEQMVRYLRVVLLGSFTLLAQERFGADNERLRGFTKSPTEHIMNEYPEVISVRILKGRITEAASKTGVPGAIIEVRKADPKARVIGTTSDESGRFQMRKLPDGDYVFKITRDGFQSVFGHVRVSKRAPADSMFNIELEQGV